MAAPGNMQAQNLSFERFLYASLGEDRNGATVTVLSALARLNLDPWKEAADLSALGPESAGSRLGLLLSRFTDVPSLLTDHGPVARRLSLLLPPGAARAPSSAGGIAAGPLATPGMALSVLAILVLLGQVLFGMAGPGN
jgi:hypothetical protein